MIDRKQYYGIKFPFTANNLDGFFLDLNEKVEDKVVSEILHVILTPKRSRIRKPDFGTNLAKYIFEPNDELTWESVKEEVISSVSTYVANTTLTNIEVVTPDEEPNSIYLDLRYVVKKGNKEENNRMVVKL
jgi:phage baseplate assembly protein W